MSTALLAAIAVILCILFRILNVNSQAYKPVLYCKDTHFLETILKIAPLLQDPYVPTRLWGFSGHVQTIIHSIIGRVRCPWPIGERCYLDLKDGTTLTYDLYEPLDSSHEDDFTLAICPGIGNTSESVYIRTFVHYAQCHGYRCAVLNHVGALGSVRVTAPRIFSYGHTGDFNEMVQHILERRFYTRIVCIGFSLGGNLITKYLGEIDRKRSPNIVGGISICQGYCAIESTKFLLNWQNFRRFYLYVMTESMKSIILRHRYALLSEEAKGRFKLNEHEIISSATLPELDEAYTRKVHQFTSVTDMYHWSSSVNYLKNIEVPMIFINARDDPLVPEQLLVPIKDFASQSQKVLFLELAHGGHLGFYEGGLVYPNPVTWLDRTLVALVGSLALVNADSPLKKRVLESIPEVPFQVEEAEAEALSAQSLPIYDSASSDSTSNDSISYDTISRLDSADSLYQMSLETITTETLSPTLETMPNFMSSSIDESIESSDDSASYHTVSRDDSADSLYEMSLETIITEILSSTLDTSGKSEPEIPTIDNVEVQSESLRHRTCVSSSQEECTILTLHSSQ